MKFKTYKMIMQTMYIVMLLLAVVTVMTGKYLYLGVALAVMLAYMVFRYKFWRCPQCGALLARGSGIHCNECHWDDPN